MFGLVRGSGKLSLLKDKFCDMEEVLGTIWNGWHSAGLGAVLCSGPMETASGMGEGRCLT